MRSIIPLNDYISEPICCSEETVTYFSREKYQSSLGIIPRPRANSTITYVLDGEYYIVYGGVVATRHLPEEELEVVLNKMKELTPWSLPIDQLRKDLKDLLLAADDEFLQKFHQWPGEWLKEKLRNSLIFTDEVWKFHVHENRWELLLPATNLTSDIPERPQGHIQAIHHYRKKKIFYFCSWNPLFHYEVFYEHLFEFDYLANKFKKIEKTLNLTQGSLFKTFGIAIDYSNDTLIYQYGNASLKIICLETYRDVAVDLRKVESSISWEEFEGFKPLISFTDNYNELILFYESQFYSSRFQYTDDGKNIDIDRSEFTMTINWEIVRREFINPFLDAYRCCNLDDDLNSFI